MTSCNIGSTMDKRVTSFYQYFLRTEGKDTEICAWNAEGHVYVVVALGQLWLAAYFGWPPFSPSGRKFSSSPTLFGDVYRGSCTLLKMQGILTCQLYSVHFECLSALAEQCGAGPAL